MKEIVLFSALALVLSACAMFDDSEQALVHDQAQRSASCRIGIDCDQKWARANQWVKANIAFPATTVTPTLLITGHPSVFGRQPGVTVTQSSAGYNYVDINIASSCGALSFGCSPDADQLKASFVSYVMAAP